MRILAALFACLVSVVPAAAEGTCFPWEETLVTAYREFGQVPTALAVADGGVIIVTVNPETKAWTMFIQPDAETVCILGAGEYWAPPSQAVIDNVIAKGTPGEDS